MGYQGCEESFWFEIHYFGLFRWLYDIMASPYTTGLPSSVCVVGCAFIMAVRVLVY